MIRYFSFSPVGSPKSNRITHESLASLAPFSLCFLLVSFFDLLFRALLFLLRPSASCLLASTFSFGPFPVPLPAPARPLLARLHRHDPCLIPKPHLTASRRKSNRPVWDSNCLDTASTPVLLRLSLHARICLCYPLLYTRLDSTQNIAREPRQRHDGDFEQAPAGA